MALETILASNFAVQVVYPFLLVFTLVFAILQKSKLLGEGKQQIDALIALAVALILIAFSWATDIITQLMPFLAVSLVILLVFMLLWGFVASGEEGLQLNKGLKITLGIVIGIAVVVAVIVATGQWSVVWNSLFVEGTPTDLASTIFLIALIGGAFAIVLASGKKKEE